jgi:hypothetical protein
MRAQLKTPSTAGSYEKGTIITKKGQALKGYIYMDMLNPQEFQKQVNFIDEKTYQSFLKGKQIKKDIEVYQAKDLERFTLDNGRIFKKGKYINLLATRTIDVLPKNLMLELVTEGKISVYKKHHHTQGIVSGNLPDRTKVSDAEYVQWQENNFEILFEKEGESLKNLTSVNIKALIGDSNKVLTNYNNDYYGFQTLFTKGPIFDSSFQKETLDAFLRLVQDYNQ